MVDEDGLSSNIMAGGLLSIKKKVLLCLLTFFSERNWRFSGGKGLSAASCKSVLGVKCNFSTILQKICVLPFHGWFFGLSLSINTYFCFFLQNVVITNDYFKQCCQLMAWFLPNSGLSKAYPHWVLTCS